MTTGFSTLNSNWGKRTCKRPIWMDNCAWLGISSERLACCGKGTCHGFHSTVGTATTEIRTLRELGLHTFIPLKQDYFTDNGNVLLVKAITWYRHPYLEPQIVDLIKCPSQDVMVTSDSSEIPCISTDCKLAWLHRRHLFYDLDSFSGE